MSEKQEKNIPKTLTLNVEDIKAASEFKTFKAEGFVEVALIGGDNDVSSGKVYVDGKPDPTKEKVKRCQFKLTFAPLKKPGNFDSVDTSVKLTKYLSLPDRTADSIEPEDAAEEKATRGKIVQDVTKTLRYLVGVDEVPSFPKKQANGKYVYMGEEISKDDVNAAKEDMNRRAMEMAHKFWAAPERWITPRKKCFAKIAQTVGGDGVARPSIHWLTDKLPEGAQLIDSKDWYKAAE